MPPSLPPIHAIIVGINDYSPKHGALSSAVKDANAFNTALQQVSQTGTKVVLTDDKAKKGEIIEAIKTVAMAANRHDAFVFFFSGYAAQTTVDGAEAGIICTHDIDTVGGISDAELLQAFDDVSRSRGNNITLFLDCAASTFTWKNPSSCVIVAPNEAKETKEGGAFTNAIIKVLTDPQLTPINFMTVQTFTKYVQAASALTDIGVHCFGYNIDRPLFKLGADRGHYALIPGRSSKGGEILLLAGTAHAVRLGARYGIYNSNVNGHMVRIGGLNVAALCDDDITAVLHGESDVERKVLNFFFAVEEQGYFDPVTISVENPNILQGLLGWKLPDDGHTERANITVKHTDNKISLQWNGLDDDDARQGTSSIQSFADKDRASIQRAIVRAARFRSQLMAPSPEYASLSERLKVKFQEVNTATQTPIGENLLKDNFENARIGLEFKPQMRRQYCCTIVNDNPFPVWPYIFFYDSDEFTILSWYLPPGGRLRPPLAVGEELKVGHGNNGPSISLKYQPNQESALFYVKIFVTGEKTDFRFFSQPRRSVITDNLRCTHEPKEVECPPPICGEDEGNGGSVGRDYHNWASMRITILQSFKKE